MDSDILTSPGPSLTPTASALELFDVPCSGAELLRQIDDQRFTGCVTLDRSRIEVYALDGIVYHVDGTAAPSIESLLLVEQLVTPADLDAGLLKLKTGTYVGRLTDRVPHLDADAIRVVVEMAIEDRLTVVAQQQVVGVETVVMRKHRSGIHRLLGLGRYFTVPFPTATESVVAEVVASAATPEPVVAEPVSGVPVVSVPVVTELVASAEPVAEPVVAEPVSGVPVVAEPVVTELVASAATPEPVITVPVATEPVVAAAAPEPAAVAVEPIVIETAAEQSIAVTPAILEAVAADEAPAEAAPETDAVTDDATSFEFNFDNLFRSLDLDRDETASAEPTPSSAAEPSLELRLSCLDHLL